MPICGPRNSRRLLAIGTLATLLAITACGPEEIDAGHLSGPPKTFATASSPGASPTGRPAGVRTIVERPGKAGGLQASTHAYQLTDLAVDPGDMRDGMHMVEMNFEPRRAANGRRILVVAVDGVPEDPNKRREHLWRGLIDYALETGSSGAPGTSRPYPPGSLGGSLECLPIGTDAVCGWADVSTAGAALFPRTAPAEAAGVFAAMRADLEH